MKFKAAVLVDTNKQLEIMELELPKLQSGQVLIEFAYSGVCHSQVMEADGLRGTDKYLPHLLGHEGTGWVREIGPEVSRFHADQRVIAGWIKTKGIDSPSVKYKSNGLNINAGAVTTFNEFAIISENRLSPIPSDEAALDKQVLLGCAIPTGAGIVYNSLKPQKSESVLVWGLGGIGISALLAAKSLNPKFLAVIDVSDEKLELAKSIGVDLTINPRNENVFERVKAAGYEIGFDRVVEAAGLTETIEMAYSLVRKHGGKLVFASHPSSGTFIKLNPHDLISGKFIEGSWGGGSVPERDYPLYTSKILNMNIISSLISQRYSLDKINDALNSIREKKAFRPLIDFKKS